MSAVRSQPAFIQTDSGTVAFELMEANASGITGTATLIASDDGTTIILEVSGTAEDQIAAVFFRPCSDPASTPDLELNPPNIDGTSETFLADIFLDDLRGEASIAVYTTLNDERFDFVCGDVPAGVPADEEPAEGAATPTDESDAITSTGIGSTAMRTASDAPLLTLAGLATALALGGMVARRRASRA
ncbi:MAG TPA: hypothetical protein VIL01_13175 [Thermomicrobiales bacterium]